MRIEIRGRDLEVTDELTEHVRKRFARLSRQVSPLARLEVELSEERNPAIRDRMVVDAKLHVKGGPIVAKESTPEMLHSIHAASEDVRRQVKRMREKRLGRTASRRVKSRLRRRAA